MLSSFITRLMLLRQFDLEEKEFKILGKSYYLQSMTQLAMQQKMIKDKYGTKGLEIIYKSSKKSFLDLGRNMEKFSESKIKFFEAILNLVKHFGFGDVEIIEMKEKEFKAIVQVKHNAFAMEYARLYKIQKEPIDYSLAGILAGYFSLYFNKDVDCQEESCIAKNKPLCSFIVKP